MRIILVTSLVLAVLGFAAPAFAACTVAGLAAGDSCRGAKFAGANFQGRDLTGVDLSYAELTGANLTGANLTDATLVAATLTDADATDANFLRATLYLATSIRINLTGAWLLGTQFHYANLTGANLQAADVYRGGANFREANLSGADLRSAQLDSSSFVRTNLRGANIGTAGGDDLTYFRYADFTGATWIDGSTCSGKSRGICAPVTVTGSPDAAAAPKTAPIRPQPGLWRADGTDGTGYLFERTAGGLRLIVIGFDGLGAPAWSIAEGLIGPDNVFTASLRRCTTAGGTTDCATDLGVVTVAFASPSAATLLAPNAVAVRIAPAG